MNTLLMVLRLLVTPHHLMLMLELQWPQLLTMLQLLQLFIMLQLLSMLLEDMVRLIIFIPLDPSSPAF